MTYDLIGDIHGFIVPLEKLFKKLNYRKANYYLWIPPENHKTIFLGDYIDRGESSLAVLKTVRAMVDAGYAIALLGNHEYNAILFHTEKPGELDLYLRDHSKKNTDQHKATIVDFDKHNEKFDHWIEWFKSLPVYFETEDFIAVHAAPIKKYLEALKKHPDIKNGCLTDSFILKSADKSTEEFIIIENLIKGPEIKLPDGLFFKDKGEILRYVSRINWWLLDDDLEAVGNWMQATLSVPDRYTQVFTEHIIASDDKRELIEKALIPEQKKIFIGHYWQKGEVSMQTNRVACLDYSIAKEGELVAYTYSEGTKLDNGSFTSVY